MLASAPPSPPPPPPQQQQPQPPSRRKATKIGWPNVMGCFGSAAAKTDHDDAKKGKQTNKRINQQLQKDKQVYRATHRLLLLGEWRGINFFLKNFSFFSRPTFALVSRRENTTSPACHYHVPSPLTIHPFSGGCSRQVRTPKLCPRLPLILGLAKYGMYRFGHCQLSASARCNWYLYLP